MRANLPPRIDVDINGNLSGTQITTHFPSAGSNKKYFGIKIETALQEEANAAINSEVLPPKLENGVLIVNAAVADLARHYYEIPNSNGSTNFSGKTKDSGAVARALLDFAGDENSALVLSSLLLLKIPIIFLSSLPSAKGEDIGQFLRYVTSNKSKYEKKSILDRNGNKQTVNSHGMGGTRFKVSRDGDQFKVLVKLDAYLEHRAVPRVLPIHQGGAIRVKFEAELIIDVEQARARNLVLAMPAGIKSEWSGRLDLSLMN
jgi:hypothetical protein